MANEATSTVWEICDYALTCANSPSFLFFRVMLSALQGAAGYVIDRLEHASKT